MLYRRSETWPKFSENTCINYLHQGNSEHPAYPYLVAVQLTYLQKGPAHNHFTPFLNRSKLAETVAPVVQNYLDVSDVLKIYFEKNKKNKLIESIIHALVKDSYGFTQRLNIIWIFKHLHLIKSQLYPDNFTEFLQFFNSWSINSEKLREVNIDSLNKEVVQMSFDQTLHKYKAIKAIYEFTIKKMKNISSEIWLSGFESKNIYYFALKGYLENSLLDSRVTKSTEFMNAYRDYLNKVSRGGIPVPTEQIVWKQLLKKDYLHKGRIKRIYDDCLDHLLKHSELKKEALEFFMEGLMLYATTITHESKADEAIRKLILPLADYPQLLTDAVSKHSCNR